MNSRKEDVGDDVDEDDARIIGILTGSIGCPTQSNFLA